MKEVGNRISTLDLSSQFSVLWSWVLAVSAQLRKRIASMMQARNVIYAMMFSLWSMVWITSGLSLANEALPVKPEPAPAAPHPHAAESEAKLKGRRTLLPTGPRPRRLALVRKPPATMVGKDGAPMVLVPAGEFTMGSEQGDDDEQPVHRVFLDSFYLDTFEVTNGRFAKFVAAIQSEPPWGFADQETPGAPRGAAGALGDLAGGDGLLSLGGEALADRSGVGESGARHRMAASYPWGNEPPTPAHAVFGLKEGAETVSPIGNREKGSSPYGVHDLAGNLYEWVSDWYDDAFYTTTARRSIRAAPPRARRRCSGAGRISIVPIGCGPSFRTKGDPTEHDPHVGFRCAQDAPALP